MVNVNTHRDYAIDNLKGVLIILVILGHASLLTAFKTPLGDFLQGYIYLFHMPLFFGVSALFIKGFSRQYLAKRFIQLMLPFYFFVIIDPVHIIFQLIHPGISVMPLLFDLHPVMVIKKVFIGSAFYLQNALWFLPALFISNIIFAVLYPRRFNITVIITFGLVFCLALFFSYRLQLQHYRVPYGIDTAVYTMPLLFLLRYIYEHRTLPLLSNIWVQLTGILASSLLAWYLIPQNPSGALTGRLDLAQLYVPGTPWGYLLICALSVFIFLFFLNFKKSSVISIIGRYTLPIFIWHTYPWFGGLSALPPAVYLPINVIGNVLIGIGLSKLLMKISPKFSWIGMVA